MKTTKATWKAGGSYTPSENFSYIDKVIRLPKIKTREGAPWMTLARALDVLFKERSYEEL